MKAVLVLFVACVALSLVGHARACIVSGDQTFCVEQGRWFADCRLNENRTQDFVDVCTIKPLANLVTQLQSDPCDEGEYFVGMDGDQAKCRSLGCRCGRGEFFVGYDEGVPKCRPLPDIDTAGGGKAHNNLGPRIGVSCIIAMSGTSPTGESVAYLQRKPNGQQKQQNQGGGTKKEEEKQVEVNYTEEILEPQPFTHFIGEMRWAAFRTEPEGWHFCDGTYFDVDGEHSALFEAIGCDFGCKYQRRERAREPSKFAIPDMRARAPVHFYERERLSEDKDEEIEEKNRDERMGHGNNRDRNIKPIEFGEEVGQHEVELERRELPRHKHDYERRRHGHSPRRPDGPAKYCRDEDMDEQDEEKKVEDENVDEKKTEEL